MWQCHCIVECHIIQSHVGQDIQDIRQDPNVLVGAMFMFDLILDDI